MNPEAFWLTASILSGPVLIIVCILSLVVLDMLAATKPRVPGRHRAPRVIDGEVVSNDTVPIVFGGARWTS